MIALTKVNKTPEDFDGQEPSYEARLEIYDRRKNHNKFWQIQVFGNFIVRRWGRHGTKGQSAVHSAWNSWGAEGAAQDLVMGKRSSGYTKDTTTALDHMAREIS